MIPRQDSDHPIDRIRFGLMVAIGGEDASETLELLEQQEQVARRELEEVPKRAEARGTEFLEFSATSRDNLIERLESYLQWIVKAKGALEQQDSSEAVEAYEESQEILPELNSALDAYSRDFAAYGRFGTAVCNTLDRVLEGVLAGQAGPQAWAEYCRFFATQFSEKLVPLGELALPGRSFFKHHCAEAAQQLRTLEKAMPATTEAAKEPLSSLDLHVAMASLFELEVGAAQAGPTAIPSTNVMIDFLNGWLQKQVNNETLQSVMEDYADLMDGFAETFEGAASKPTDSALVQEEIPRTLDTMDSHYSIIEEMLEGLEDMTEEVCRSFIERLKETADKLKESQDVYATAAQHQTQITCPSCGRSNPPENRNCEACGEILLRPEDTGAVASSTFSVLSGPALEENQQMPMTENVARLFNACDDVAEGNISDAEFLAELQRAALGLKEFAEELDEIAAMALDESMFATAERLEIWKTQHLPFLEDVAVTVTAGLKEAEAGLQSMQMFLTDPDRDHLIEGIRLVWQGLSTVNRGRLSMEAHTKMLGDIMQEARERGMLNDEE